ncbi:SLATT domain-containing protein [Pseudomonas bohemica]|uniref:SLATT domain-containing protein n=1 Tax=Pseudomonas bohemica TaxID=2044872 RepID=UPI000DA63735|nr:SLATT domain-containing protein [Pseudomonas bohemica]
MKKEALLKSIADVGYNIGFGGRKHWATYDIVDKVPGLIGFASMAIGIFALIFDELSAKVPSATLLVLGVASLYISFYDHKKDQYESAARELTKLYESLRDLYREVDEITDEPLRAYQERLDSIRTKYYEVSLSKQILFSDWYAHYKFYWQYQIDWVDEQKHFRLFRDKLPLSLMFWVVVVATAAVVYLYRTNALPFMH